MKLIFLDIDGVLNFNGCPEHIGTIPFVSKKKMRLLKHLVNKTDAALVLSSTWRYGWFDRDQGFSNDDTFLFCELEKKFQEYGLFFLSKTPILKNSHRGTEIQTWLNTWTGEPIDSFVILDDHCDVDPYRDVLIWTSSLFGLRYRDIRRAIRILNS